MRILTKGEYYGSMSHEHKFNGIILSEYDYSSPKTDWHFHENPYLMYLIEGNLYDINKKQKTVCPSGSLLLHNWQEPHYNEKHSRNARGFHIEFETDWFKQNQLNIGLWEGSQLIKNPNIHHLIAKLYFEFKCNDIYTNVSTELLLLQLCENIESEQSMITYNEPRWVKSLREILDSETTNLSLNYLSKELQVHPAHLSRAVPKYLRTTLGDYIRRQKIKTAINYLLSSNTSLTQIAHLCRFSDQSHFTRVFKMYMGMTPKQYQQKR